MPRALLLSPIDLEAELGGTMLWRHDFERVQVAEVDDGLALATDEHPDLILVDTALPRALWLVEELRRRPQTQRLSIAVLARGGSGQRRMEFIDAGAHEILRLPAGPEWDERLVRLIRVPGRKEIRFEAGFLVSVTPRSDREAMEARGLNLSAGGLLLATPRGLTSGDQLRLVFRLPESGLPVAGTGWVVREAAPMQYGVEFLYLDEDGLDQVRHFVETCRPAE